MELKTLEWIKFAHVLNDGDNWGKALLAPDGRHWINVGPLGYDTHEKSVVNNDRLRPGMKLWRVTPIATLAEHSALIPWLIDVRRHLMHDAEVNTDIPVVAVIGSTGRDFAVYRGHPRACDLSRQAYYNCMQYAQWLNMKYPEYVARVGDKAFKGMGETLFPELSKVRSYRR